MKPYAKKVTKILFYILPAVLFFSYHPVISLAESSVMNLELSLPEIWLVIFFVCSLPLCLDVYRHFGWKKVLLASILPIYFTLGIIWSGNRLRTLLTAGIFWLIVYAILNFIFLIRQEKQTNLRRNLLRVFLASATVVSVFCWMQSLLDLAGVTREYTLLCRGCVSTSFGFPHPNGFTIEPQFMGNLLIAPVLLCFYLLVNKTNPPRHKALLITLTIFLTTTLFITFSRGAIYAFVAAIVLLLVLTRRRKDIAPHPILRTAGLIICSFLISLTAQGIFSAVGPTSDTFVSGVTKSIHQLSLGKIDLRPNASINLDPNETYSDTTMAPSSTDVSSPGATSSDAAQNSAASESQFSGYVAESTDTRLNLNGLAVGTFVSSPRYVLIGTGLGSAGIAIHNYAPSEIGPKEIVQNEYVSLLLETGLTGIILVALVFIFALRSLRQQKRAWSNPLFFSVVFGFALTLCFFSGLPNALHIYLLPVFFISLSKNDPVIKEII